jgi:CHAT domain-containing protein
MKSPHASRRWSIVATALLTLPLILLAFRQEAFTQGPPQLLKDPKELVLGVAVSAAIARGESHSYPITLAAGEYVRVVVEQQGVDLTVRVFHPDGRELAAVDSPHGQQGHERISLIAKEDGNYRVEVHAWATNAQGGPYEVKIHELRAATTGDRNVVAGQTAYSEAERARAQKPAKRQEAIKKYEEALGFYRAAGEQAAEATTLTNIGVVYNQLGERQKSLQFLNEALRLHKLVGDRREQARTLAYMGYASSGLVERQNALEYFNQALRLSQSIDDGTGEATALNDIAGIYGALGEKQKALEYLNLALARSKAVHHRALEVSALSAIGAVYNQLGDTRRALEYFNEALAGYEALGNRYGEALTLTNIGFVYNTLGEWQKALEYFNLSLPMHKAQDDRRWTEGMVLTSIGFSYSSLGQTQKALEYLNQALPLHKSLQNRNWEAYTLTCLGMVYESLGQREKALDYFNQALTLNQATANHSSQAANLLKIARTERNRGNLHEARNRTEAALDIVESLRTRVISQDARASFLALRRDYYEFYVDLLMRLDQQAPAKGHAAEALQASERAHARSLLDTLNEARVDIRQGVDPQLLERERNLQQQINHEELRRVRVQRGKSNPEEIQAIHKRINELVADYGAMQAEIRIRSPRYAALTQPVPLTLREIQQQVLDEKTILLEYALGEEKSYLWVVTQSELQSFVLPRRSVVEAAARRAYDLLMVSHKTEARRAAQLAIAELGRMVLGPAAGLLNKERLVIVADGALEYVPFAALPVLSTTTNRTSTPALESYQPLIARHEVVSLPSASVLAVLRQEVPNRQPASEALAVLADAVFQSDDSRVKQGRGRAHASPTARADDQAIMQTDLMRSAGELGVLNFPRLPFSRKEADAIVARVGEPGSLKALDFAASRETVFGSKLGQYRIIHFATHGLLNSQHPALSGIVLSLYDEEGRPIDGFLRAHEIYNLKLNAELVVLSACRTALGREIKGEGLVGLTRGFMYAGTPSVVASLWDIRDQATAELMSRFYERMFKERMRPAAALRAAQVSMWQEKRWAAPYYWAGFILQGEWK